MRRCSPDANRVFLGGVALCAAAVAVPACSGDDVSKARPNGPVCQVLWASPGSLPGRYDIYLLEMAKEAWAQEGEHHFSIESGVFGMFYDEYLDGPAGAEWETRAIATEGSFVVSTSLGDPYPGTPIVTTDDGNQSYLTLDDGDELGAQLATGGAGGFQGVWSTDGDVEPEPGAGLVTIALGGTAQALELGTFARYAQCYEQEPP